MKRREIFTIGHSDHPPEEFAKLLKTHSVSAVAYVRSAPYSRRFPQYNREELKATLGIHDLKYVFLGKELGARRVEEDCYSSDGQAKYLRIRELPLFRRGIERLLKGIDNQYRLAIMCAERKPENCHRAVLVCPELKKVCPELDIKHILADGKLLSHEDFEKKLVSINKEGTLFGTESASENAYQRQAEKIAYARLMGFQLCGL